MEKTYQKMSKVPERRCLGCMKSFPKKDLIRFVKSDEGICMDIDQKKNGRGCYLCRSESCLSKAVKKRAFERAFSLETDPGFFDWIREEIK